MSLACFLAGPLAAPAGVSAQTLLSLPPPGQMVGVSPAYMPVMMAGVKIHPENPLQFDFIINKGDADLEDEALKDEAGKLIKYFLASLTVPEEDLWVNLSPYEGDRMIPQAFGLTEMGRDLLAQDYLLKQFTASMVYPEDELGKKFWSKVYQQAYDLYGTTEIPVNTFNKVWIVPDEVAVFEDRDTTYVVQAHLKVMLEEDYLSMSRNSLSKKFGTDQVGSRNKKALNRISSQVIRELVLPAIEKEVNEGKGFANLRQIVNAMVLAIWYKTALKDSLLGRVYADREKTAGIELADPGIKDKIYEQYLSAFRKGVYHFIREEYDPREDAMIPRKYFSGGFSPLYHRVGTPEGAVTMVAERMDVITPSSVSVHNEEEIGKWLGQMMRERSEGDLRLLPTRILESNAKPPAGDTAMLGARLNLTGDSEQKLGTKNLQKIRDVIDGRQVDGVWEEGRNTYIRLEDEEAAPEVQGKTLVIKGLTERMHRITGREERPVLHIGAGKSLVITRVDERGREIRSQSYRGHAEGMLPVIPAETEYEMTNLISRSAPDLVSRVLGTIKFTNEALSFNGQDQGAAIILMDSQEDIRLGDELMLLTDPDRFENGRFVNEGDRIQAQMVRRQLVAAAGALRKLHELGVIHRFFHLGNIQMVGDQIRVRDLERAQKAQDMTKEQFAASMQREFSYFFNQTARLEDQFEDPEQAMEVMGIDWRRDLLEEYFGRDFLQYFVEEDLTYDELMDTLSTNVELQGLLVRTKSEEISKDLSFGNGIPVSASDQHFFLSDFFRMSEDSGRLPAEAPDPIYARRRIDMLVSLELNTLLTRCASFTLRSVDQSVS